MIIKRSDVAKGFEILPRHRVVARTFGGLARSRRLAMHRERTIESALTLLNIAQIRTLTERLAQAKPNLLFCNFCLALI